MHMPLRTTLPAVLMLVAACASNPPASDGAAEPSTGYTSETREARLVVSNRSNSDMDIYALRSGGSAVRVGFAPASETTTFRLNTGHFAGSGVVRFQARPARQGEPVVSEPFTVDAGQEITWDIPPQ
jgi:hypothetical protein